MQKIKDFISIIFPFIEFSVLLQDTQDYNYPIYLNRLFKKGYGYIFKRNFLNTEKTKLSLRLIITIVISVIVFSAIGLLILLSDSYILLKFLYFLILFFSIPILVLISNLPTATFRLYYIYLIIKAKQRINANGRKIVAITGSTGKTTTRKMLVRILEDQGSVLSTQKNYNSLWGNSKVLSEYKDQDYIVLELAMDSPGHVKLQSNIIKPDLGAVLNIGYVHMENIGSIENIFKGKKALSDFLLKHHKPVVINSDDKWLKKIIKTENVNIISYGYEGKDYKLFNTGINSNGTSFSFIFKDKEFTCTIPIYGKGFCYNALSAIALAYILGIDIQESIKSLSSYKAEKGRFEITDFKENVKIINDAYNANPTSMRMSIETFDEIFNRDKFERIVILGDMKELGEVSSNQHKLIGDLVKSKNFDHVYYIGDFYNDFGVGEKLSNWKEAKKIVNQLNNKDKNIAILLKASNSIGLFNIIAED